MTVGRLKFHDASGWVYAGAGLSGTSGYSGYSGVGTSGYSGLGLSGYSGYSGYSGVSGYSGTSGYSGGAATASITFIIDGAGSTITTGIKGDIEVPFACTITAARLAADQSGSIAVGLWKDTYANYPPTGADLQDTFSITTATKSEETGLSIAVTAGDFLRFNVDSCTTIQRCTVSLTVTKA